MRQGDILNPRSSADVPANGFGGGDGGVARRDDGLVGTTPTQGTSWSIPATAPLGFELFAQSLALFVPGSLPNGQNPAGLTTSNAVASRLGAW